ncbi:MAG: ABC transporter ATP-binding protein [Vicingaceae bacterium]|nr:ABC transporter ATP-binding protein [Vicingaceae bacterium]
MKLINNISLRQLLLSNKYFILLGLVLLIINKAAIMFIPSTGKYVIDDVIKNNDKALLIKIVISIIISLFIQAITSFALTHLLAIKAQKTIAEMRTHFFYKVTHLPLSYFKNSSSGELTSRTLNDFDTVRVYLGNGLVDFLGGLISLSIAIFLMYYLSFNLALYVLVPTLLFGSILFFIYKNQKKNFTKRKVARAKASSNLTEAYRAMKIIKGFGSNRFVTNIIKDDLFNIFYSIKTTLLSTNLLKSFGILFVGLVSLLVMWFGSNMVINNELTIGELTTFTMYLGFMITPVIQITKNSSQFTDAQASIDRINETLNLKNENINKTGKEVSLTGNISLQNISFSYDNEKVLDNISIDIKPNTINAFVGKSGTGKTTLIDLIAGFHNADIGTILIENENLKTIHLNHYRNQLGFVFQDTFLFNDSIKQNILIANPNASEHEIKEALKNANATQFINELPKNINTIIGENGSKLSEGQKQRIAIARAFLSNPKVLILDEATSNLDAQNQKEITASIKKLMKNRTIIIVAHRLNTIKNADQIIMLENGKIIENGTHDELIKNKSKYYNLYNS